MKTQNKDNLAIVFDLDNTLIDSRAKLKADVIEAMQRLGHYITPAEAGTRDWYTMAAKYGVSEQDFDASFDKRKTWEESLQSGEVPIFLDTIPCLEKLAANGTRLALLSKSIQKYTDVKLEHFGLRDYFETVETVHLRNPNKREGAISILETLGPSTVKKAWFVGDKPEDVVIAKDISDKYSLSTGGIYVNRNNIPVPAEVEIYHSVKSLDEIQRIIQNGK